MPEFIEQVRLTDEERERLGNSLRWHFNCHADEPDKSYASLGIQNAVLIVERILTDRLADERRKSRVRPDKADS